MKIEFTFELKMNLSLENSNFTKEDIDPDELATTLHNFLVDIQEDNLVTYLIDPEVEDDENIAVFSFEVSEVEPINVVESNDNEMRAYNPHDYSESIKLA